MKIVALEEHYAIPELLDLWRHGSAGAGVADSALRQMLTQEDALLNLSEQRIAGMDDQGVDVQVLSLTTPGTQDLGVPDVVSFARRTNDALAEAVAAHPDRFEAFAAIPTPDPAAAAAELERAVITLGFPAAMINGRTGDVHMDDRSFDDLYGVAARLGAPIQLHPQSPPAAVHEAYYAGFGPSSFALGGPAIAWHYETGIEFLRMVVGGVFDRHPDLQIILGHWGELVLFYLERAQAMLNVTKLQLQRPLDEIVRENVSVAGSGILSERYFRWAAEVVGTDRIMTSTDYPLVDNSGGAARRFIEELPVTDAERAGIASGNWERLTARVRAEHPTKG